MGRTFCVVNPLFKEIKNTCALQPDGRGQEEANEIGYFQFNSHFLNTYSVKPCFGSGVGMNIKHGSCPGGADRRKQRAAHHRRWVLKDE